MKFLLTGRYSYLTCLLLLLSSPFSYGANKFTSPPQWVKQIQPSGTNPKLKDISDGFYVEFVEKQINIESRTSYERQISKVVTEMGIPQTSEISVTYDPSYERIEFHEIIIWREGKAMPFVDKLQWKSKSAKSSKAEMAYDRSIVEYITLSDVRIGDRVEYSFSRIGRNPILQNKYTAIYNFGVRAYVSQIYFRLLAPKEQFLDLKSYHGAPIAVKSTLGSLSVYEWELKNIHNNLPDNVSDDFFGFAPHVQVTEFKSWAEVVNWTLPFYAIPSVVGDMKVKTDLWKSQSVTENDYMSLASRYVQDQI